MLPVSLVVVPHKMDVGDDVLDPIIIEQWLEAAELEQPSQYCLCQLTFCLFAERVTTLIECVVGEVVEVLMQQLSGEELLVGALEAATCARLGVVGSASKLGGDRCP